MAVKSQAWGQLRNKRHVIHEPAPRREVVVDPSRPCQGVGTQGLEEAKVLMEQEKMRLSTVSPVPY